MTRQVTDVAFEARLHLLRGWAARLPEMGLCPPTETDPGIRRTPLPHAPADLWVEGDR
jgi:hypothetical protein